MDLDHGLDDPVLMSDVDPDLLAFVMRSAPTAKEAAESFDRGFRRMKEMARTSAAEVDRLRAQVEQLSEHGT